MISRWFSVQQKQHSLLFIILGLLLLCSSSSTSSSTAPSTSAAAAAASNRKLSFGRTGNIQIDFDVTDRFSSSQSWPEAIRLVNNVQTKTAIGANKVTLTKEPYPYSAVTAPSSRSIAHAILPTRRTYSWQKDSLVISFPIQQQPNTATSITAATATSPSVPPLAWFQQPEIKMRHLSHVDQHDSDSIREIYRATPFIGEQDGEKMLDIEEMKYRIQEFEKEASAAGSSVLAAAKSSFTSNPMLELTIKKTSVERTLAILHSRSFSREDIFRLLDKAPWIFAFDVAQALPKLQQDLMDTCSFSLPQTVHIISHCPYLLAQYSRWKGRDLQVIVKTLLRWGASWSQLQEDILRFPALLTSSGERLQSWKNFLRWYSIADSSQHSFKEQVHAPSFYSLIRRASFMYYQSAPTLVSSVAQPTKDMLDLLVFSWKLTCAEKIVRTSSELLLIPQEEVIQSADTLLGILSIPQKWKEAEAKSEIEEAEKEVEKKEADHMSNLEMVNTFQRRPAVYYSYSQASNANNLVKVVPKKVALKLEDLWTSSGWNYVAGFDKDYRITNEELRKALNSLVETNPAVLAIPAKQMRESLQSLEDNGFDLPTLLHMVKQCPQLLSLGSTSIKGSIYFLKQYCGLRQMEMLQFVKQYPRMLTMDVALLQGKVDYLYQSLGFNSMALLNFPQYLTYDLMKHIMPRCEFLRSVGKDPARLLQSRDSRLSLKTIMTASAGEMERIAGNQNIADQAMATSQGHIFESFQQKFIASMRRQT